MKSLRIYLRVIRYLASESWLAVLLSVANIVLASLQFLDPILFGRVIELLSKSSSMQMEEVKSQAFWVLGMWFAVGFAGIVSNMLVALHADRFAHRLRLKVLSKFYFHVLSLPVAFHTSKHSGEIHKYMLSGTDTLFNLWLSFFREQLSTVVSIFVLLPLTLLLNWRMGLCLIVLLVIFGLVTSFVIRKTENSQRRAEKFHASLASTSYDAITNVMVVQSFTQLDQEKSLFSNLASQMISTQFPVLNWWAFVTVMNRTSSTLAMMTIISVGTYLHVIGMMDVGDIVSFMGFAGLLIGRMEGFMFFISRLFFQIPVLEEFFEILDTQSTVIEQKDAQELKVESGAVSFENVSFGYPGGPLILNNISFEAQQGMSIALVGPTGAGKSTAMNLLQRLWEPTQGSISIDGQPINSVTLESLHRSIGSVFQESLLFNRSIRENLLIGKPDASEEELEEACKQAQAHDFISKQPMGYDTMIGERGSTLSGGQRQRLAIARALLKNPPILVLDEATSALDAATEAKVGQALKALMQGRTTFIIAHRLSTVRDADQILVFDGGTIIEQGKFQQLIALNGKFAELVHTQLAPLPDK